LGKIIAPEGGAPTGGLVYFRFGCVGVVVPVTGAARKMAE